jgi:type IV pilus assembly protein PilO
MNLSDINELDIKNIGAWPVAIRAFLIGFVGLAVFAVGYLFHIQDQFTRLDGIRAKEGELKQKLERLQRNTYDLKAYGAYLQAMEDEFSVLLRQLPSKAQVANLVEDISRTGLSNQLIFNSVQPGTEINREFYAELPIRIQVTGTYHQLAQFVNGVAALPRIVTLHDLALTPVSGNSDRLNMDATAKIFWYQEPSEQKKKKQKR